jgi:geranylgeranyl pyrophosphate synthase
LELSHIYAPINEELVKLEEALKEISQVDFPWLEQLLNHALGSGGKRIRPALTFLSGKFYQYDVFSMVHMASAIELMHTATLIHDDAIDNSDTRRGRPTIFKLWGIDPAVLLGDYMFAKAGVEASETENIRAIKLFSQTLMTISRGELNQAVNAFNINQSREDYFQRIFGKTGSLFCLSTESGSVLSQAPESSIQALKTYGHDLGLAFQIVDDILDYTGTEEELGKPAGSDLAQGTLTLPGILLNERFPGDNPVKRLFQNRTETENIKKAIEQVRNSSIVDDCYQIARDFCDNACSLVKILPSNSSRQALVELADFVVKRKK